MAAHPGAADLRDVVARLWAYRSVLVKRLAIHAIRIGGESDDDKLIWLFSLGAQDIQLRHEVYALLKQCYPNALADARRATIAWVQSFEPGLHVEEPHRADARDRWQLEVLWWLKASTPDCQLVLDVLGLIEARHADWLAAPDTDVVVKFIQHATGQRLSPVTVDELLEKPAAAWMDLFMNYKQERPSGPDQESLWLAAQEAAKRSVVWERGLLTALEAHWDSDMWSTVIAAWSTWPDDEKLAVERLHWLGQPGMVQQHAQTVSHVLRSLVAGTVKPYAASLLPRADGICRALCAALEAEVVGYEGNHWLDAAINRPAGALADYLGDSLQFRPDIASDPPTGLSAEVKGLMERLLLMRNGHVAFVRPVLARRLVQFTEIDPGWVEKTIVPWLSCPDDGCFAQAWDGFLYGGRFSTDVGEMAKPAFLAAPVRIARLLPGRLDDFLEVYVIYALLAEDPLLEWIPHLVQNSDAETRYMFARRMHWLMANEPPARVTAWWNGWLKTYWERRLVGMPKPLTGGELGEMLGWPAVLPQAYAESVQLAAAMPKGVLQNTGLFQDLTERGLPSSDPQTTAMYLNTVLGWQGADAFLYEVPDVVKEIDESKVDAATLHALEAAMALVGLQDVKWAGKPAAPGQ